MSAISQETRSRKLSLISLRLRLEVNEQDQCVGFLLTVASVWSHNGNCDFNEKMSAFAVFELEVR